MWVFAGKEWVKHESNSTQSLQIKELLNYKWFFQRTVRISTKLPRDFCLMVNYKQKTGAGIDLTKIFSLRHTGTFCCLVEIPCPKSQAVPPLSLNPKGIVTAADLSKWAHYQSVHPTNTPSAMCAWREGSESKLNKELECSWNSACNHFHIMPP